MFSTPVPPEGPEGVDPLFPTAQERGCASIGKVPAAARHGRFAADMRDDCATVKRGITSTGWSTSSFLGLVGRVYISIEVGAVLAFRLSRFMVWHPLNGRKFHNEGESLVVFEASVGR